MAPPSHDSLLGPVALGRPNPFPDIFDLTVKTTYEPGPSMGRGQSGQSSSHPTSNPCIKFFIKASRYTADHTRKKTPPEYWYLFMRQIECSVKLDFLAFYNQILDASTSQNLSPDKMPNRIFVFTNRDFQKAFKCDWRDNYKEALKNYRRRGYQTVPDGFLES